MFDFAKTNASILSLGLDWLMFNLVPIKFQWFRPFLWPKMALFWPEMAIFGHRQSQQAQMGWTLVEHGWTLYFTSGGVSLSLLDHPEMSPGGPRSARKRPFWPEMAIFGHRQSQQAQMGWTLVKHGWTLSNTSRGVSLGLYGSKTCHQGAPEALKNSLFWPKMAIFGHKQSQQVQMGWTLVEHGWTWLNIVKHIQGGQFGPLGPQKNVTREPQKRPKTVFFGLKLAIFGCFWHPPVALSRGLNGFNISPWMCPVMFNQV